LADQPQHSLPDIFVWMIAGSKRVAFSQLNAGQIIYSEETSEMGKKCGRRITLFPRSPNSEDESDYHACKVEAFLWLGDAKYTAACWSAIPPGYEIDHYDIDTFPKYIEYNQFAVSKQQSGQDILKRRFRDKIAENALLFSVLIP